MARAIAGLVVLALLGFGLVLWLDGGDEASPHELSQRDAGVDGDVMDLPVDATDAPVQQLPSPAAAPAEAAAPDVVDVVPELVVRVVHADGEPARVHGALQIGDAVEDGGVSLDGTPLRFPGRRQAATLWLSGATWSAHAHALDSAMGEHEVRLPGDVEISGFVSVDGATPGRPLQLNLRPKPPNNPPHPVGRIFRRRTPGTFDSIAFGATLTDIEGRFRVAGLPEDFAGQFTPPGQGLVWAAGTDGEVVAHERDVHLALVSRPMLTGRLVSVDGTPAAHAELDATVIFSGEPVGGFPNHGEQVSAPFFADDEGRFRIPLRRETLESVVVRARHPEFGRLVWEGGPYVATVSHDVGDLQLWPARDVTWVARTPDGTPLVGAVARLHGWRRWSEPTDADGRGLLLDVPLHDGTFEAVGDACSPTTAYVPDDSDHAEAVLEPCTSLQLALALPEGVDPALVELRLISQGELKQAESDEVESARNWQGWGRGPSAHSRTTLATGEIVVTRRGGGEEAPWDLQCLVPGGQIDLYATDAYGFELDHRSLVLQPGTAHDVVLTVHTEPAALDLTVLDTDGRAAEGWWISAVVPADDDDWLPNWGSGDTVDEHGHARLEGLWARALVLTARHRDGAEGSVELSVPPGGGSAQLVVPTDKATSPATVELR